MTEKELQEIDARIAELEAQSDEYERQIKELEEKKSQVDEKISDLETQASTYRVLNSINDVTEENSMQVWLSKDTRTTPVMSKFCDSDKSFLTIPEFMYPRAFLLVVTKYHYGIQYIDSGMTMTDLKQEGCSSESRVKRIAMSDRSSSCKASLSNAPLSVALAPQDSQETVSPSSPSVEDALVLNVRVGCAQIGFAPPYMFLQ